MKIYNILEHGVQADSAELQTAEIQAVLDLCKDGGGKVIFPAGTYRVGDTVSHKTFGTGMIVSATQMANDTLLEVAFDKVGTKKLFANFAHLTKM